MEQRQARRIAMRVSFISIAGNILLSAFKLFAGVVAQSGAIISDAVHSLSDVVSTVVVIAGIQLAGRAPDKRHPYGHDRLECVAAIVLAGLLCATGVGIGCSGFKKICTGGLLPPGGLALVAAAVSVAVKEAMFRYTRCAARKIQSSALMADAWHHRSDALSSIGSFAGVLGARMGLPALDSAASVVISLLIVKAAVDIFRDAVGKMTDESCGDELEAQIRQRILAQEGVLGVDQLKTRQFGDKMYVDVEIRVDGDEPLRRAHAVAELIHHAIESAFPGVKHCMVHVNPDDPQDGPG